MDKIAVMIVDKQIIFRIGVRHVLAQQPDFEIVDSSPRENLMECIEAKPPDVLLLDIDHPSFCGLNLARQIVLCSPHTKIIMLTSHPDDQQLFEVIKSGALAYLDKSATAAELVKTVSEVYHGEYLINDSLLARPACAERVLRQFQNLHINVNGKTRGKTVAPLTPRETEILKYIADGSSNKQIAAILQVSEPTVKNHVSHILRKLHANDRAHAVFLAVRYGWISAEELQPLAYLRTHEKVGNN